MISATEAQEIPMERPGSKGPLRSLFGIALAAGLCTSAWPAGYDWSAVEKAIGRKGSEMPGGVYRVGLPRTDLKVRLDGVDIKPGLALGSWLAFRKTGSDAMVMGDLVLTGEEVNPVMRKLEEGGIEITALHNHLLRNEPFTMYMHVLGHGEPVKLAATLKGALAESRTPMGAAPPSAPQELGFDPAAIERVLGHKGKANGPIYAVSVPRAEPVK
jgi:hypothetical protein